VHQHTIMIANLDFCQLSDTFLRRILLYAGHIYLLAINHCTEAIFLIISNLPNIKGQITRNRQKIMNNIHSLLSIFIISQQVYFKNEVFKISERSEVKFKITNCNYSEGFKKYRKVKKFTISFLG